jgi:hypothetical protein
MTNKSKNIIYLREKFIENFCKKRGWNSKELTTGQMLFIISQPEFRLIK